MWRIEASNLQRVTLHILKAGRRPSRESDSEERDRLGWERKRESSFEARKASEQQQPQPGELRLVLTLCHFLSYNSNWYVTVKKKYCSQAYISLQIYLEIISTFCKRAFLFCSDGIKSRPSLTF